MTKFGRTIVYISRKNKGYLISQKIQIVFRERDNVRNINYITLCLISINKCYNIVYDIICFSFNLHLPTLSVKVQSVCTYFISSVDG